MQKKLLKPFSKMPHINTAEFQNKIYDHYKLHGRVFPWRQKVTAYKVLVSEVMLQQTYVQRVVQKFPEFIKLFPDLESLAKASLSEVLHAWQGLGYNRRAKYLHDIAKILTKTKGGDIPSNLDELIALPGIGKNTAGAILAYAYNLPAIFIETNIRTVFIHEFFQKQISLNKKVKDEDILKLVEKNLDAKNPSKWYSALMDYGTHLKRTHKLNNKSAYYHAQSKFQGSRREVRAAIIRCLLENSPQTITQLHLHVKKDVKTSSKYLKKNTFHKIITSLQNEKLIYHEKNLIFIS